MNLRHAHPPPLVSLLLAAAAVLSPTGAARGTTYWVATPAAGGSDANAGSAAAPWATLQHAADQVGPGDTVLVRAGDYAAFEITTSGTAQLPIAFRAAAGELVRIVTDVPGRGDGINIEGASHLAVEGFHVAGRTRAGIRAVLCDGVRLRGNVLEDNGRWGILTGCCDDLEIVGNRASGSVIEHGIYVSNSGDRPLISGNVIFSNRANGIHMNGDASIDCDGTTDGDGVIENALVTGNTIYDNGSGGGSGINCDGVQSSTISNNLIYQGHASGISLYQIDGGAPASNNRLEHNTVLVAADGRWALNIQDGATGTIVRNNVFWSDHSFRGAVDICPSCLAGLVSNHNLFEDRFTTDGGNTLLDLDDWRAATGQDASSQAIPALADLFVASANGNFHLRAGSAALDAGGAAGVLTTSDLEGFARPAGAAPDAGAFEGAERLFAERFEAGALARWSATEP